MPVETKSWPPKTPDAVLDYLYTIPLDDGDAVASYTVTKLSGSIVKDSDTRTGADVTVKLSGGTDGEFNIFQIAWTTDAGRSDDAIVTVAVVAVSEYEPAIAEFLIRYPAFAAVNVATIAYWLKDAETTVTDDWIAADISPARMALAAHNLAASGYGTAGGAVGNLAAMGVTSFKSASMSVNFSDSVIAASAGGGYASTKYGVEFRNYLRRNRGGARLIGCV